MPLQSLFEIRVFPEGQPPAARGFRGALVLPWATEFMRPQENLQSL